MKNKNKTAAVSTATAEAPTAPAKTSRPQVGDVFNANGKECVVWFSSETKIQAAPLGANIDYRVDDDGKVRFIALKGSFTLNRSDEFETTRSLGREGLRAAIDEIKAAQPEKAEKKSKEPKAKKEKKSPGTRAGSLGTYKGFSIASVVRTLATAGWKTPEIRAFLDKEKIEASDQTIKLNVYRVNHPERPDAAQYKNAPLEKKDFPAKPVIEEKAKKAPKAEKLEGKKAAAKVAPKADAKPAKKVTTKIATPERAKEQIAKLKAAKAATK